MASMFNTPSIIKKSESSAWSTEDWNTAIQNAYTNLTNSNNSYNSTQTYLSDYLKTILQNGLDTSKQRQTAYGNIGKQTKQAVTKAKENMASSGMSKSGVAQAVYGNIYGGASDAYANVESNLADRESQYKLSAVSSLLGLTNQQANQALNTANLASSNYFGRSNIDINNRDFAYQQQQNSENDNWWSSLLGSLLGGAAQVGSAYYLGKSK